MRWKNKNLHRHMMDATARVILTVYTAVITDLFRSPLKFDIDAENARIEHFERTSATRMMLLISDSFH